MQEWLIEWALTIVGSGGIGAAITYLLTINSKRKQENAKAEDAEVEVAQKKENLHQDQYEYLQKTCDKYIKDYHELEGDFRKQMSEIRDQMDNLIMEKSKLISNKCNEIAELKSKVTYLKGIRCYNFTCPQRIKENPDKTTD